VAARWDVRYQGHRSSQAGFQWNPKDKRWWIAADRAYATELLNEISATGAKVVPDDEMPPHLAIVGYGYTVREEMK
jgi:hypothetical protein